MSRLPVVAKLTPEDFAPVRPLESGMSGYLGPLSSGLFKVSVALWGVVGKIGVDVDRQMFISICGAIMRHKSIFGFLKFCSNRYCSFNRTEIVGEVNEWFSVHRGIIWT